MSIIHFLVKEVLNYFIAVINKEEVSERALKLTEEVIRYNPANYTAWYFFISFPFSCLL